VVDIVRDGIASGFTANIDPFVNECLSRLERRQQLLLPGTDAMRLAERSTELAKQLLQHAHDGDGDSRPAGAAPAGVDADRRPADVLPGGVDEAVRSAVSTIEAAKICVDRGDRNAAGSYLDQALVGLQQLVQQETTVATAAALADAFTRLADVAAEAQAPVAHKAGLEWTFRLDHLLGRPAHPDLCSTARRLWRACLALGDPDAAHHYLSFALEVERAEHGEAHESVNALEDAMAELALETDRPAVAEAHARTAVEHADALFDAGDVRRVRYRVRLGHAYRLLGNQARARAALAEAEHAGELNRDAAWQDLAEGLNNLGLLSRDAGETDLAVHYFDRALGVLDGRGAQADYSRAAILGNMANAYMINGELNAALAMQDEVLSMKRRILPEYHLEVAITVGNIGLIRGLLGDMDAAADRHRESLTILRQWHGEHGPHTLRAALNLGRALIATGRFAEGRQELQWVADHPAEDGGQIAELVELARQSLADSSGTGARRGRRLGRTGSSRRST